MLCTVSSDVVDCGTLPVFPPVTHTKSKFLLLPKYINKYTGRTTTTTNDDDDTEASAARMFPFFYAYMIGEEVYKYTRAYNFIQPLFLLFSLFKYKKRGGGQRRHEQTKITNSMNFFFFSFRFFFLFFMILAANVVVIGRLCRKNKLVKVKNRRVFLYLLFVISNR